MIPYSNEHGLRDWRVPAQTEAPRHGWIWLALLVALIVLLDVAIAHVLRSLPQ